MAVALAARVTDTQANQTFDASFERFPVRIGRNQLNDMHIDRPYVSQFHAAIDVRDRKILVKDLGSTNGTVVAGRRLARDTPIDVTQTPEVCIGPVVIRLGLVDVAPKKREEPKEGTVLDLGESGAVAAYAYRPKHIAPGAEDAYIRQLVPYLEAYRAAWGAVYRVVYDHLQRLPPDVRTNYLRRLTAEHTSVSAEPDFQTLARYYGLDPRSMPELGAPNAAFAALMEIARTLAPDMKAPDDVPGLLGFARRLRDTMEVFMKCFVSLRDGYQSFEEEVLARERIAGGDRVSTAKDARELGMVLLDASAGEGAARKLHDIFADVMSHQIALLNGVMEGVKTLLVQLSPRAIEEDLERRGKKGGLFSNRFEELWKAYEVKHADYSGEDKETFLIIFGPQFARAYAASTGEDYKSSGEAPGKGLARFTMSGNPKR